VRRLREHPRVFAELRAELGDQGGVGALAQHAPELRAIVVDRADAVDDDVADEPAAPSLVHPVLDEDLAPITALDHRRHPRLVTGLGLAAPRHDHAVDGADGAGEPRDHAALEELGEEAGELLSLGWGPRLPFSVEHGGRGSADVRDVGDEPLDTRDFLQRLRLDGGIDEHPVHRAEKLTQAVSRRAGTDGRRGQPEQAGQGGGGKQETSTRRATHIYNICRRLALMI